MGISLLRPDSLQVLAQATTNERTFNFDIVKENLGVNFGTFLLNLLGAVAILLVGFGVALLLSGAVRGLLRKLQVEEKISNNVTKRPTTDVPVAKWAGSIVFWLVMLFAIIASLEALELRNVSGPLSGMLDTVIGFLPNLAVAGVLLAIAWAVATVVKTIVSRGLESLNLDERLAQNTGVDPRENAVQIHDTLGSALYWFIFLLFIPLILDTLELDGLLAPVEGLISQFLQAIPQIIIAALIAVGGWLLAKVVRDIVTNLLSASGVDRLGEQLGLNSRTTPTGRGFSLSQLAGTLAYVAVLIPVAIIALEELDIRAISEPAVGMLNQVLNFVPQLVAAGAVVTFFYFIGRFVGDLVTNLLSSVGFDSVLDILGLPDISSRTTPPPPTQSAYQSIDTPPGATVIQPPSDTPHRKSPSEVVGLIVLVGIVLFGVVSATDILELEQLTLIVRAVMEIAGQVLVGVIIFGVGLYVANLAYRLISSSGTGSSNLLAQAARVSILAFVGALALAQMGVATNIVNLAFGLLLGAVAVAIAIAFGLGGRDVAAEELRNWVREIKK